MRTPRLTSVIQPISIKGLVLCFCFFSSIFFIASNIVIAQEFDFRSKFTDAEYYFLFEDYQEALPLYISVLDEKPENSNLHYRIGLCYLNIPGLKHKASHYLEKAIQNINPSYQEGSHREEGAPINAHFFLGEAYRIQEKFDKAIESYNTFRDLLNTRDVYNLDYVDQQIRACKRAQYMIRNPLNLKLAPIEFFDSERYIISASKSYDGNHMLMTVKERFYDAIYLVSKDENGEWEHPVNITLPLAVEGEMHSTSINYDGTEIFLFKNDRGVGNIYTSQKKKGEWQKATKLGRNINSRRWETYASLSPDGKTLFFSSNRRGGHGGLDIYYSERQPDGEWGNAVNFGSTINTPHNEDAPHFSPDGNTLYFISQGHNSMGGYDIFYSERIGENEWSTPINMGYPLNTSDDNMGYFPLSENRGLILRVVKGNPNVRNLLETTILPRPEEVEVNIVGELALANSYEVQGNKFKLSLVSIDKNDTLSIVQPEDLSGRFSISTHAGAFRIIAEGEGYTTGTLPIVIPVTYSQPEYAISITLTPDEVTSGEYLAIRSILFEFDCSKIDRNAEFELEKIFGLLLKHEDVRIEVSGHTDSRGSASYNYDLSLRRANSVIDFLVNKGIDKVRLEARGAGPFENVASNYSPDGSDNPAGRKLNRRASIKVLSSDLEVTIANEIDVPEHLKPREQNYTILLAPVNKEVDSGLLKAIDEFTEFTPKKIKGEANRFAHTIGSFEHKSNAIKLLNYSIDSGFPLSTIIGEYDLSMLLKRTKTNLINR